MLIAAIAMVIVLFVILANKELGPVLTASAIQGGLTMALNNAINVIIHGLKNN